MGTPDEAISAIEGLLERSGGFGALMVWGQEWAGTEATNRSYELLARDVAPRFQGALAGLERSERESPRSKTEILHR